MHATPITASVLYMVFLQLKQFGRYAFVFRKAEIQAVFIFGRYAF